MEKHFSNNFFRKDLELEKKWWHRLAKIFFVVLSLIILVGSAFGFYFAEENNARQYKIIKNFGNFVEESKNNCLAAKAKLNPGEKGDFKDQFSCYLVVIPSFLQQNTLKDYSLGCLLGDNKVEYLSEFSFKDDTVCTSGPEYKCTIPRSICDGNASKIVKYDYEIKYGFFNYFSIALKTLGVFVSWVLLACLIYFKGLLYIIFGGKKHENN